MSLREVYDKFSAGRSGVRFNDMVKALTEAGIRNVRADQIQAIDNDPSLDYGWENFKGCFNFLQLNRDFNSWEGGATYT